MVGSRRGRSPWQRAVPETARPASPLRAVALAVIAVGAVALAPMALLALSAPGGGPAVDGSARGPVAAGTGSSQGGPTAEDAPLDATPQEHIGLAFLALEDPLERAESALGPPDHRAPDTNATVTSTWELAGGTELDVTADELGITGLAARAPVDPDVRIRAYGGAVVGEATPAEIADRWGDDHEVGRHAGDDFVLRYTACIGPFPVVVKFDQEGPGSEVRWDEPVTRVFIAYADAEPGTAGCPEAPLSQA